MSKTTPDHHDAQLLLQVYDLRRETVMRESRNAMFTDFQPKSYDDFLAVTTNFEHPVNRPFRQVSSYWEMVFGIARNGIVNSEYWVENNGEGLFLFAMCKPYIERYRDEMSPFSFQHAEWAATETEIGRRYMEFFQQRMAAMANA